MKTCGGDEVYLHLALTQQWMEVSSQLVPSCINVVDATRLDGHQRRSRCLGEL